jgi:hypothetical protein
MAGGGESSVRNWWREAEPVRIHVSSSILHINPSKMPENTT